MPLLQYHLFVRQTGSRKYLSGTTGRKMIREPFWKSKSLRLMTKEEWESLCDGCGLCCLNRFGDSQTGRIITTAVSCAHLDLKTCRCLIYETRFQVNPECCKLRAANIKKLSWLPRTCAYRTLTEGRELAWWHPLVSGDPDTVHAAGISVRNKAVSEVHVHPEDMFRWT